MRKVPPRKLHACATLPTEKQSRVRALTHKTLPWCCTHTQVRTHMSLLAVVAAAAAAAAAAATAATVLGGLCQQEHAP